MQEIERFIERFRYKSSKARQVQSRIKMLDRLERIEVDADARHIHFHFPQPPRTGRLVGRLAGIHKAYGDNVVYAGMDFLVERGERVALVGPNGAGKSTLLKMLAGVLSFERGERLLGSHVAVHYYAQHQLDALVPTRTVLEEMVEAAPETATGRLRTILGSFLFSGDSVDKRVAVLSGGEKARLALAKMLVRPAAFLCMDEPTNHLDLASKEVLEAALLTFTGTIVFISHDRYFINRIATRVVDVVSGRLTDYLGDYDSYLERKAAVTAPPAPAAPAAASRAPAAPSRPAPAQPAATRPPARPGPPGGRGKKGIERELRAIRERLATVETQIQEMEARLADIGLTLADPDLYRDGERAREIAQSRKETEERVTWLMREWEDLSQRLASVAEDGS